MATTTTPRPSLKLATPIAAPAIATLVEEYLAHCRSKGLSPKTISGVYGYTLRDKFLPWCAAQGITDPGQLNDSLIERFASDLREHGGKEGRPLAARSIKTYVTTVGFFLTWTHEIGQTVKVKVPSQRVEKKLIDILSREEIQRMENAARNERDKLIVRILGDYALREGELVGLRTPTDVRDEKNVQRHIEYFLRVTGKGRRERDVPIQPAMYRRIQNYVSQYRPKDSDSTRLFLASRKRPGTGVYAALTGSGVRQLIGTLAQLAGLGKRVYPHLLRHSALTYMLQRGMDPIMVAKIAGHSSLAMIFSTYAHLSNSDASQAMMRALSTVNDD